MIQQINESEKNRIRNLHREHFILNEDNGFNDIPGFKKMMDDKTFLIYTKDLGSGKEIQIQYIKLSNSLDIDLPYAMDTENERLFKILLYNSRNRSVVMKSIGATITTNPKEATYFEISDVDNVRKVIRDIVPILNKWK